jgi:hypothetical protein
MHHAIAFSHLVLAERYFFKLFPLDYINPGLLLCTSLNNNFTKQLHVKYHCISIADYEKMQLHDSSFEYTDCTNKDDGVENFTCAAMEKKSILKHRQWKCNGI